MTATAAKGMSAAEFLAWAETRERGRYELFRGEIFAMAPERAAHVTAKAKIWRALSGAIAKADLPSEAFVDGLGVAIDDQTVYEPDALVNCGEAVAPDSLLAPSPSVIVEVISPSSRNIDTNAKLGDYFRVASVIHYLVVDLGRRLVLHYQRQGEQIVVAFVKDGAIMLDPPGLAIETAEIFS
ncbi:Uma2 family endonuclease [Methylocystis sp. WRRC1]|uniref:Uma2 family endonuclease n=1 Tax=Methylocystis sp. WRRC1 TaxID=1732014 RepID=UPI001D14CBA3|nr:Uma2 family endonuclease [Methylocystis sp. WRRC1]MCC3247354.1 Uma2 family endonuclease [Methylocystis sp. WRRC1]